MEELSEGFWLTLLSMFMGGGAEPAPQASPPGASATYLVQQLSYADTWSMVFIIEQAYERAGISINDTLVWEEQAFDQIVNWYSPDNETITISALPLDDEIAPYWDNWSAALTGSRWDWHAFFVDETEARDMARFNQFVLAAHEYGHALTYRFDPDHLSRHDHSINCREYPADRLAAGLLEEFAAEDEDFARWRLRYADVSFEALENDCAILAVDQPTAETMAPYASAFLVRWQALLNEDLPPLAELYQTYLEPHWHDRLVPGASVAGEVDFVDWVYSDFSTPYMDGEVLVQRFANFTAEGELRLIEVGSLEDDEGIRLTVRYGLGEGKQKTVIEDLRVPLEKVETLFFDIMAALPLGPDRFILASSDLWDSSNGVLLFEFRRTNKGWAHKVHSPLPAEQDAETRLIHAGGGKAYLDLYSYDEPLSGWHRFELDLETMTATGLGALPDTRYRFVGNLSDGRHVLVSHDEPMVLVADEDGTPYRIAGNGLQGFKDSDDPLDAEFATIDASVVLEDRIRILDYDPKATQYSIRDILLK